MTGGGTTLAQRADRIIVVTGATGNQGRAAVTRLLAEGWRVRALTRDADGPVARRLAGAGAAVVPGSLEDRGSLESAVEGAHGVFCVLRGALGMPPVSYEDEVRRGVSVVDAAAGARVQHLVYTSVAGVERGRNIRALASKWEIEEHIRRTGLPATILRLVSFMENYADPAFGVQTGALATPFAPGVPEQLIALDDIGAFVARAFGNLADYLGKAIAIAGDELRPERIAAAIGRATGRHIPYVPVPLDAVHAQNADVADVVGFLNRSGGYGADIAASRALHPGLMSFETWLNTRGRAKLAALFDGAAATR
jgi:uncharacterized protein YbjT (DUF2867 family)